MQVLLGKRGEYAKIEFEFNFLGIESEFNFVKSNPNSILIQFVLPPASQYDKCPVVLRAVRVTFSEHAKDTTDPDCKPISPRSVFAELAESDLEDAAEEEKKDTFVILRNEARHIAESGAAKQEQQLADDRFRLAFLVEESELEEGDVEEEEEEEGGEEQEAGRGSGDTNEDGEKKGKGNGKGKGGRGKGGRGKEGRQQCFRECGVSR